MDSIQDLGKKKTAGPCEHGSLVDWQTGSQPKRYLDTAAMIERQAAERKAVAMLIGFCSLHMAITPMINQSAAKQKTR